MHNLRRPAPLFLCCALLAACHQKGPRPLDIPKFSMEDGRGFAHVLVNEPTAFDHTRYDRMTVYAKKISEPDYHDMGSGTLLFEPGLAYDIGVKLYSGKTLVAMTRESDPACPVLRQERFFVGENRPLDVEVCDQISQAASSPDQTTFAFPTTSPDYLLIGNGSATPGAPTPTPRASATPNVPSLAGPRKPAQGQTLAL